MDRDRAIGGIVGVCVGDAVGLPVEYRSRSYLRGEPVTDMIGFGTHNLPPGTWSSNSSLALCTAESLALGFSLPDIAARYVTFLEQAHWTPSGEAVDLAPSVAERIERLARQKRRRSVEADSDTMAFSILSRTLPLTGSLEGLSREERLKRVVQVASLTNGDMRTALGCFILTETALELGSGHPPKEAYHRMRRRVGEQLAAEPEINAYARVLETDISQLEEDDIYSEGEVTHVVEASLWCLLTQSDFRSVVLTATNLGGATHTTASAAGGLAGFALGLKSIPATWVEQLSRSAEILDLAKRLSIHAAPRG